MLRKPAQYVLPIAFSILLTSTFAHAQLAPGAQDNLKAAMGQFEALLKDEAAKTSPPRLTDAKAKPVFDALFDRSKILGASPYKAADVEPLLAVFGAYFSMTKTYLGFRKADSSNNIADNEFEYQNELTKVAEVLVENGSAIAQALNDYANTTPAAEISEDRKSALARMRMGVTQVISGVITLLNNPRYEKENKVVLATAIAEAAPSIGAIMPVSERHTLSQSAMQTLLQTPPEAEAPINAFMNALGGDACEGLCALK